MKQKLIIVAHPHYERSVHIKGFINEISVRAKNTKVHILDQKGNFDVNKEQKLLLSVDVIIFAYPTWWYSAPWLLTKWIDEVFTPGFVSGKNGLSDYKLYQKQFALVQAVGDVQDSYAKTGHNCYNKHDLDLPLINTIRWVSTACGYLHDINIPEKDYLISEIHMYGCAFSKENNWEPAVVRYLKEIDSF
ncbi:NAD(P)H-dependent oxidoreductase [[Mycoplasma] testudinis]|uniref:NAD(P)H-dependent oxidoreductase n=1 Tax=[Mycoplasma] testudinis TaxID=33924 RepID=UPI000695F759|nr:NAD(P)H-dependent oxidoreductase [[Mycoplasma] testudinis]